MDLMAGLRSAAARIGPFGTGVLVHTFFHTAGGAAAGAVASALMPDAHKEHGGGAKGHIAFGALSGLLSGIAMELWMRRSHAHKPHL
jgi:hypothetical protein